MSVLTVVGCTGLTQMLYGELGDTLLDRGLQGAEVAHVGLVGDHAAVEVLDELGGLGEVVGVAMS